MERHYTYPALSLISIQGQYRRNKRAQSAWRDLPMSEEQFMPGLCHHPGSVRQGPWSMCHGFQNCCCVYHLSVLSPRFPWLRALFISVGEGKSYAIAVRKAPPPTGGINTTSS